MRYRGSGGIGCWFPPVPGRRGIRVVCGARNAPARQDQGLSASRVAGSELDSYRAAGPHPGQHRRAGITGVQYRLDIQVQGGQVQALTRRRTIRPSRPPPAGQRHPGARRDTAPECTRAGSSQASSSWLINGETTAIVTGPKIKIIQPERAMVRAPGPALRSRRERHDRLKSRGRSRHHELNEMRAAFRREGGGIELQLGVRNLWLVPHRSELAQDGRDPVPASGLPGRPRQAVCGACRGISGPVAPELAGYFRGSCPATTRRTGANMFRLSTSMLRRRHLKNPTADCKGDGFEIETLIKVRIAESGLTTFMPYACSGSLDPRSARDLRRGSRISHGTLTIMSKVAGYVRAID